MSIRQGIFISIHVPLRVLVLALHIHSCMHSTFSTLPDSIIAIDGYSSCGKSTLAKDLAKTLQYRFIDSGAMYRCCALYFLDHLIDIKDIHQVNNALENIDIDFIASTEGINTTLLNGQPVEKEIRTLRVSQIVSEVAAIKEVREKMVALQQHIGLAKRIVMDGRDIGSVVFPDAEYKFFITADPEIRAMRRYLELQSKGEEVSLSAVKENLIHRDHIDSTREESPLIRTSEHILIDNSYLSRDEQLLIAQRHIMERTK